MLVPDLGADAIRVFSAAGGALKPLAPIAVTPPGTGPRHGVFVARAGEQSYYYLVGELANTVLTFRVRYARGTIVLTPVGSVSTLPRAGVPVGATPGAAEIQVSACGRWVYVSNRGDAVHAGADTIAVFARNARSGALSPVDFFSGRVLGIRHFSIDPSGKWLVTEGQYSNNLAAFRLDAATGKAQAVPGLFNTTSPVCLTWAR